VTSQEQCWLYAAPRWAIFSAQAVHRLDRFRTVNFSHRAIRVFFHDVSCRGVVHNSEIFALDLAIDLVLAEKEGRLIPPLDMG
jgi:hypothetical protein